MKNVMPLRRAVPTAMHTREEATHPPEEKIWEVPGPPAGNGPAADHPFAFRNILAQGERAGCQKTITKLSFSCYLQLMFEADALPPAATRPRVRSRLAQAFSAVRSSDYSEAAEDNRARTCFGGLAAHMLPADAWLPDSRHPPK